MVLAIVFAAVNLEWSVRPALIGLPVVFLILGAALLRHSRTSAEHEALKTSHRSRRTDTHSMSL